MKKIKAHPVMVLQFLKPFLFVLLLPMAYAGVRYLINGSLSAVIFSEIPLLILIIVYAVFRTKAFRLSFDEQNIYVESGFLIKGKSTINKNAVTVVKVRSSVISLLTGCRSIKVNTEAGRKGNNDFIFVVSKKDAQDLCDFLYVKEKDIRTHYSAVKIALMAASTSSLVTGAVIGIPLFRNCIKIFGTTLRDFLMLPIETAAKYNKYLPPVVNTVSFTVLGIFLFGFLIVFARYIHFSVCGKNVLIVRSGLVRRNASYFYANKVNAVVTEQNLLMRLLSLKSLKVEIGGIDEERGDSAVISPAISKKQIKQVLSSSFPEFYKVEKNILPKKGSLYRFFYIPFVTFLAGGGVIFILTLIFPDFIRFSFLLLLAHIILCLHLCRLGIINYRVGGIGCDGKNIYSVSTSKGKLCELYCKCEKLGAVTVRRTPADRRRGTCTVSMRLRSETAAGLKVKYVDYAAFKKYMNV